MSVTHLGRVLDVQSTLDNWNLHGTEKNGSTYRMFHLSEWFDKWNLNEIEKRVPLIEPFSYLKSQETEEFTNTVIKNRVTVVFMFSLLDSNRIFAFEKRIFLLK